MQPMRRKPPRRPAPKPGRPERSDDRRAGAGRVGRDARVPARPDPGEPAGAGPAPAVVPGSRRLGPEARVRKCTPVRPCPGPLVPLAAIVLVLVGALALREVATIIVPVVFGLFLALVAWPMVGVLERRGARHAIALTAALMVVLAIVLVAGGILALSVAELVLQVPKYEGRLRDQIEVLQDLLAQFGITTDPGRAPGAHQAGADPVDRPPGGVRPVRGRPHDLRAHVHDDLRAVRGLVAPGAGAPGVRRAARPDAGHRAVRHGPAALPAGPGAARRLRRRPRVPAAAVLGVPFPALWAFLVFAASFIPNIGTFIAVIPPTIMAFLSGGLVPAVAVIVGYVAHQLRPGPLPAAGGDGLGAQPQPAGRVHLRPGVGVDPRAPRARCSPSRSPSGSWRSWRPTRRRATWRRCCATRSSRHPAARRTRTPSRRRPTDGRGRPPGRGRYPCSGSAPAAPGPRLRPDRGRVRPPVASGPRRPARVASYAGFLAHTCAVLAPGARRGRS